MAVVATMTRGRASVRELEFSFPGIAAM
jgi:hypothetical protein